MFVKVLAYVKQMCCACGCLGSVPVISLITQHVRARVVCGGAAAAGNECVLR